MAKITINITISKARVLDEVAKTTAYIGSKSMSAEDLGTYERVAVVDPDREQLDRYWMEACGGASMALAHWCTSANAQLLTHHAELDRDYKVTLQLPTNWNNAYNNALRESIMSYLINSILSRWLLIVKKDEAEAYAALSSGNGAQIAQILLERKRPARRGHGGDSGGDSANGLWTGPALWDGPKLWGNE